MLSEDTKYWHKYFVSHYGDDYKSILNEIGEKVTMCVLSECLKKVVSCFDSVNDGEIETSHLINYAYCFAAAYMTYKYAQAHGVKTEIYCGPYHVYLMKDGLIYDTFHPKGILYEMIELEEKFILLEQSCFGEEEVQSDTFSEYFYIGEPITDLEYLTAYFKSNLDIYPLIKKFLDDNQLLPDAFFLSLEGNIRGEGDDVLRRINDKDFKV